MPARAVPGEGSGDPHHGTAQAPAHIAETVCRWCGCDGYHSEVCEGFKVNDPANKRRTALDQFDEDLANVCPRCGDCSCHEPPPALLIADPALIIDVIASGTKVPRRRRNAEEQG